ncbi:MAG TPA: lysoplasmalogenase family protein [Nocardioidaceae bacterium]|nr:lysoplasmalogenase family protein [Nocardioidaceae bacterium]
MIGLDRAYAAIALADTALATRDGDRTSRLRWPTKSALMPLLVAKVSQPGAGAGRDTAPLRDRTRTGLALSWAGDVALLGRGDAAFAAGLGCFVAAHAPTVRPSRRRSARRRHQPPPR